jgi:diadenosine tetraphosphate (Ap4A) HIT family hydrolase
VSEWRDDRIGSALRGENPMVMARMRSGFAVFGDFQLLPGYCVLLADDPAISQLSDLEMNRQREFLSDMALLGAAVETVCAGDGLRRMNYEIQGNLLAALHAHIRPRYEWEPEDRKTRPVSAYSEAVLVSPDHDYDQAKHGELRAAITSELERLMRAGE